MFGEDPGFSEVRLHGGPGKPATATVVLTLVVGDTTTIIDGSVVPSNTLQEAPRALPAPRPALPDPEYVEARLDQLREPFFCVDEEEWEDEAEGFMEGLCPDCAQEICLHCGRCNTPCLRGRML